MLESLGFAYVWNTQILNIATYNAVKQRLFDNADQELIMSINTSTKLQSYCMFKEDTQSEPYLDIVRPNKYKVALSRLRLSSHSLAIETGRYTGTAREDRRCIYCNTNAVESEFHFTLVCPFYIDLRRKYLPAYYCRWPSINKFKRLFQIKSKKLLNNLSRYIYFAFNRRSLGP